LKRLVPFLALFAAGCIDIDLPSPTVVDTPRILAITSEPPEPAPGTDLVVGAMIVDGDGTPILDGRQGVEATWTVCLSVQALLSGLGQALPEGAPRQDCVDEASGLVTLREAEDIDPADPELGRYASLPPNFAVLPGAVSEARFGGLEALVPLLAAQDPAAAEVFRVIVDEVGLPIEVNLEVDLNRAPDPGDEVLPFEGFKRVAFTRRDPATTNPPAPRFRFGGRWVSGRGVEAPFLCQAEDPENGPVTAQAGARVAIAPEEDDERWREEYPVVNLSGVVQTNREQSYYSYFVRDGSLREGVTQAPFRDEEWTVPSAPGTSSPLWVVVRDGHLGASACRLDVEVE
jgi:hypothetical protein